MLEWSIYTIQLGSLGCLPKRRGLGSGDRIVSLAVWGYYIGSPGSIDIGRLGGEVGEGCEGCKHRHR